jgi:GNAT superfamily N-acetyltransferase
MMSYLFNNNPSIETFNSIKDWLKNEYLITKSGFYCNIETIEKAFYDKELISFEINNKSIGFVIFTDNENFCLKIDIIEIHPEYRNKGIGKLFYDEIESYFTNKNFKVIELYCSPSESELFWIKMNFIKYPESKYKHELTYYKPLIKSDCIIENSEIINKIEVWDIEEYQIKDQKPKWIWDLNKFEQILIPCNIKWRICLTINNKLIKDSSIKYFEKDENRIYFNSYLFIQQKSIQLHTSKQVK